MILTVFSLKATNASSVRYMGEVTIVPEARIFPLTLLVSLTTWPIFTFLSKLISMRMGMLESNRML